MRITILGARGQIGRDLTSLLQKKHQIQKLGSEDVDVSDYESLEGPIGEFRPDWIINTAAYHQISECELNPDVAHKVNSLGARNVAQLAERLGAKSFFFSTDYVFIGDKPPSESYTETDDASPINVYGLTKRFGEIATLEASEGNIVARVSSVFGVAGSRGKGGNFVEAIVKRISLGEKAAVICDNFMSPTSAESAASLTAFLVENQFEGIFHLNNTGSVSWFEFAKEIEKIMGKKDLVEPRQSNDEELELRPANSSLDNSKISNLVNVPQWDESLHKYLVTKGHI